MACASQHSDLEALVPDTPWKHYATRAQERFCYWMDGRGLFVGAGNNPANSPSCRLDVRTKELLTMPGRTDQPLRTRPHRMQLSPWQGTEVPMIRVHPFGLLHLLVSGQVPAEDLVRAARVIGNEALYYSLPLTTPCSLLRMLGANRAVLAFDTRYDLDVRRYDGI